MSAEPEMKSVGMKMAKATEADLDAAMLLNGMLSDVFEDGQFPRGLDGEFDEGETYFDEDSFEHLKALYERLWEVYRRQPGGMNRVVFGMGCLLMPENRLVDPDKDHLAPHPAIRWEESEQEASEEGLCPVCAGEGIKEGVRCAGWEWSEFPTFYDAAAGKGEWGGGLR